MYIYITIINLVEFKNWKEIILCGQHQLQLKCVSVLK